MADNNLSDIYIKCSHCGIHNGDVGPQFKQYSCSYCGLSLSESSRYIDCFGVSLFIAITCAIIGALISPPLGMIIGFLIGVVFFLFNSDKKIE